MFEFLTTKKYRIMNNNKKGLLLIILGVILEIASLALLASTSVEWILLIITPICVLLFFLGFSKISKPETIKDEE